MLKIVRVCSVAAIAATTILLPVSLASAKEMTVKEKTNDPAAALAKLNLKKMPKDLADAQKGEAGGAELIIGLGGAAACAPYGGWAGLACGAAGPVAKYVYTNRGAIAGPFSYQTTPQTSQRRSSW